MLRPTDAAVMVGGRSCALEFEVQVSVDKPADAAWKVLGENSVDIDVWASAVSASSMDSVIALGATRVYAISGLGPLKSGRIREVVTEFNPTSRILEYWAIEGLPGFFKQAVHRWSVHEIDAQHSLVKMTASVKIGGLMQLLAPLLSRKFKSASKKSLEEFKYFVEQGRPHPRKQKALKYENGENRFFLEGTVEFLFSYFDGFLFRSMMMLSTTEGVEESYGDYQEREAASDEPRHKEPYSVERGELLAQGFGSNLLDSQELPVRTSNFVMFIFGPENYPDLSDSPDLWMTGREKVYRTDSE